MVPVSLSLFTNPFTPIKHGIAGRCLVHSWHPATSLVVGQVRIYTPPIAIWFTNHGLVDIHIYNSYIYIYTHT